MTLFCERQLGRDGDKLAAISGLARQFQKVLQNILGEPAIYLAGLWKGNMAHQLLWSVRQNRDLDIVYRRPDSWRAPSWSWASIEGTVHVQTLTRFESKIQVVEAITRPLTVDPTGQVSFGKLVLSARLLHSMGIRTTPRTQDDYKKGFVNGLKHEVYTAQLSYPFLYDFADDVAEGRADYTCLQGGSVSWWQGFNAEPFFLVLRRLPTRDTLYERVGVSWRCQDAALNEPMCSMLAKAATELITIV